MMNAKKIKSTVIASALVGCLAIGGISAYFTDGDTVTNTFTVGKVSIDLQEPSFTEDYPEITPGMEITKDPKIVNTGKNEAYGFLEVEVPYANVKTATDEGVAEPEASYKEVFTYETNAGWVELAGYKKVVDANGTVIGNVGDVEDTLDENTSYFVKHVYAYAADEANMTAIADADANGMTATLFDEVKLINLVEGNLEEKDLQIDITAYAIQTSNLKDAATTPDGTNDTITDASDIWDIVVNANPSTDYTGENPATDEQ